MYSQFVTIKTKQKIIVPLKQACSDAGHSRNYTVALCDTKSLIVATLFTKYHADENVIYIVIGMRPTPNMHK